MNGSEVYAKTAPVKLFFMIAIPGAISMIASSLWGLFDGIFVGNLLGEQAFAALNLAFPLVLINFSLADLIGVGSAVNLSISLGQEDYDNANNYFTCACLMIFIVGIISGALICVFAPFLMGLMGAEGELAELAIRYVRVYALASPFTTMVFATDNFLRICGKIKTSMTLNIVMSALILPLEYLCIGVFKMGIAGSAFAVSCGMFICTIIALYPFAKGQLVLKFCKPRFSAQMIRRIVAGGSPNFLSNIAGRLTSILMNIVLLKIGGSIAVSVYGVLVYIGDTLQQLLYGTCDGTDIWAAEIVLSRRMTNPALKLICAIPHPDFEKSWRAEWQCRYNAVRSAADLERTICPAYSKAAYQKRNIWMVDHSALLIAVFNGESGGTLNTIRYAQQNQIEILYAE